MLAASDVPIEALPNVLVQGLLPSEPDDDVAVLAVGDRPAGALAVAAPVLPGETGVASIRALVREALGEWPVDAEPDDALLVVSELVTNSIRHGKAPIEFRMRLDESGGENRLVVEVSDAEPIPPSTPVLTPDAPNGRGMFIVSALTTTWGTRPTGAGKSVWCTLPVTSG